MKYLIIGIISLTVLVAFTWSSDMNSKTPEVDNTTISWVPAFEAAKASAETEGKHLCTIVKVTPWVLGNNICHNHYQMY